MEVSTCTTAIFSTTKELPVQSRYLGAETHGILVSFLSRYLDPSVYSRCWQYRSLVWSTNQAKMQITARNTFNKSKPTPSFVPLLVRQKIPLSRQSTPTSYSILVKANTNWTRKSKKWAKSVIFWHTKLVSCDKKSKASTITTNRGNYLFANGPSCHTKQSFGSCTSRCSRSAIYSISTYVRRQRTPHILESICIFYIQLPQRYLAFQKYSLCLFHCSRWVVRISPFLHSFSVAIQLPFFSGLYL